jgi:hypothetical protein
VDKKLSFKINSAPVDKPKKGMECAPEARRLSRKVEDFVPPHPAEILRKKNLLAKKGV